MTDTAPSPGPANIPPTSTPPEDTGSQAAGHDGAALFPPTPGAPADLPADPLFGPGSQFHALFNDPRWALAMIRATVLEAAHPQIGAALLDNSTFVAHPGGGCATPSRACGACSAPTTTPGSVKRPA